jgi:hypothetical protein
VPALHELQQRIGRVLLGEADAGSLADCVEAGRIPLSRRLAVHRNTVRGGLCQALRLRHPTVERLVGSEFFDQAALAYAGSDWPRAPQLDDWGLGFAAFLSGHAPASTLPYLHEVARFDALLDTLSALPGDGPSARWTWHELAPGVELALAPSLRAWRCAYPVDEIRAAVGAADEATLARIELQSGPLQLLAWREGAALKTRRVSEIAARFIERLLAGAQPAAALELASAAAPGVAATDVVATLQSEVLSAPCAALRRAGSVGN